MEHRPITCCPNCSSADIHMRKNMRKSMRNPNRPKYLCRKCQLEFNVPARKVQSGRAWVIA